MSHVLEPLMIYRLTNTWFDDDFYEDRTRIRFVDTVKYLPFENRIVEGLDYLGRRCEEYFDCEEQLIIGRIIDK